MPGTHCISTMRPSYVSLPTFLSFLTHSANANFYLKDRWVADNFFRGYWETEDDSTHSCVNFVSQDVIWYVTIFLRFSQVYASFDPDFFSGEQYIRYACQQ